MYLLKVSLFLPIFCCAVASPEALQQLYETPGDPHGHQHHHGHGHGDHSASHDGPHSDGQSQRVTIDLVPRSGRGIPIRNNDLPEIGNLDDFSRTPLSHRLESGRGLGSISGQTDAGLKNADFSFAVEGGSNSRTSGVNLNGSPNKETVQDIVSDAVSRRDATHDFVFTQGRSSNAGNVNLAGSLKDGNVATLELARGLNVPSQEDLTITVEITRDVYTTFTNIFYNSIPVTLTQFVKSTRVVPTLQIESTPVDDRVLVSTAPVTRTDTVSVTDTQTAYQYVTDVSTDIYTITHRAYDIRQQVVSSTLVQTQLIRPTIISTLIFTEFETSTVGQTVTNTIVIEPRRVTNLPSSPVFLGAVEGVFQPLPDVHILEQNHRVLLERQNNLIRQSITLPASVAGTAELVSEMEQLKNSQVLPANVRLQVQVRIFDSQSRRIRDYSTLLSHGEDVVSPVASDHKAQLLNGNPYYY